MSTTTLYVNYHPLCKLPPSMQTPGLTPHSRDSGSAYLDENDIHGPLPFSTQAVPASVSLVHGPDTLAVCFQSLGEPHTLLSDGKASGGR